MIDLLKKWLKNQLLFFLWVYFPIILTVIFGVFMAHFFPHIAMQAIGVFFVLMLVAVFFCSR
ncbi:hypothetical protein OMR58_00300 (plasmid) [Erwinia sp. INIA-01]|uniref:hypothetical protein n=1 Tax=Erwinia sp. INIA01 TaxID=2991500 RepID=UPI002225453E|nr:hypothetical protein [Erwinia sp. INIA01]MCW1872878.1 hypothetical protein [Erwinia sp. INIA01]